MKSRLFVLAFMILMLQAVLIVSNAYALNALNDLDPVLKVVNPKNLILVVESVDKDGARIGISTDLIRAKIELQLKRNGIVSVNKSVGTDGFLYIRVSMIHNVYYLEIKFDRLLLYGIGNESYVVRGTVWEKSMMGDCVGKMSYIFENIENDIDLFLSEYIKTNS